MRHSRIICLFCIFALCLSAAALAKDYSKAREGKVFESFFADLNGDGRMEKVSVVSYNVTPEEWMGQVVVKGSDGKTLWKSPRFKSRNNRSPFLFGAFEFGISLPEIVADIDGDGKVEMMVTPIMSDVRPVDYKLFRWNGSEFVYVQSKALMEPAKGSMKYVWTTPKDGTGGWISAFKPVKGTNTYKVNVCSMYSTGGQMDNRFGIAEVKPAANGFEIVRWIKPLKKFEN